jgi:hypothetical protein
MAKQTLSAQEPMIAAALTLRTAAVIKRQLADSHRRDKDQSRCQRLDDEASHMEAGAEALDTLADPSVVHVTRVDAELVFDLLQRAADLRVCIAGCQATQPCSICTLQRVHVAGHLAEARRLLGLEPA